MRKQRQLLAVPPDSADENMSVLVNTTGGIYFRGEGHENYYCGHCGRILAVSIDNGTIRNLWLVCSKCSWLNGTDLDLGWARYVVDELRKQELSLQKLETLISDLKAFDGTTEDFVQQNSELAGPLAWLAKVFSVPALLAFLTLVWTIYSSHEASKIASEQLHIEEHVQQDQPRELTVSDVQRIAAELHRLQESVQLKAPPPPPRRNRTPPRR
jgi:hypothetical protein